MSHSWMAFETSSTFISVRTSSLETKLKKDLLYFHILILLLDENPDRWKRDGCRWWFFRNFIEDFFNVGQKVYIISEIISSNMNYEIVWLLTDYVIEFI